MLSRITSRITSLGTPALSRRARDLMSVASIMAFMAGLFWLVIGIGLILHQKNGPTVPEEARLLRNFLGWLPAPDVSGWSLSIMWLAGTVAAVAPPIVLRKLGYRLWRSPSPSLQLAHCFRVLAHALTFNFLAGLAISALGDAWSVARSAPSFSFGTGSWGLIAAILLAHIVAEVIREGAAAEAENREFV